jgi:hypothetical protein
MSFGVKNRSAQQTSSHNVQQVTDILNVLLVVYSELEQEK